MFVCVESVLLVSILLATCLIATSSLSLSPEHVHSRPGSPITFTCRVDQEVDACEFLVRFNDLDLGIVNAAQAPSGSWNLALTGDEASVVPVRETFQSQGTGPANQHTKQIPDRTDNGDEPMDLDVRGQSTRTTARMKGGSGSSSSGWHWQVNSDTGPVTTGPLQVDSSSKVSSRTTGSSQLLDQDQWPVLQQTARRPISQGPDHLSGELSSRTLGDFVDNHMVKVLRAKGAVRQHVPMVWPRAVLPYPPNEMKCSRRRHQFTDQNRTATKRKEAKITVSQRFADDGYRWQASFSKQVCTLTLPAIREGLHLIGCRTRVAERGWEYSTPASMDVNNFRPMNVTVQVPPISNPGSNVSLFFNSAIAMTSCRVNVSRGNLLKTGADCSAAVRAEPGLVWVTALYSKTYKESRAVFIRVRNVLARLELELPKTRFTEGEFFTATCAAGPLLPPAPNVSWYIGEELLRTDADDDFPNPKWMWPWEARVLRQSVFLTVTPEDDNLSLTCQIDHPDLPAPLKKSVTLRVDQDTDDGTKDCGLRSNDISSRIVGNTKVTTDLPWVAAIYRRMRDGKFEQLCGGTLVTRRLVISSAQCFWDVTFNRLVTLSQFRVVLGNTGRDWMPSKSRAQSPGIVRIVVPKHYFGRISYYAYDIAVLVLDSPVTLSVNVVPACIDRNGELPELQPGDRGTVAGWGVTETGHTSPQLRSIDLPYVDNDVCYRDVDENLHSYITYDKFCAGFQNQSKSVCPGDSGGGLVFAAPDSGRYYLRGIASVAFAPIGNDDNCYADLYTGFTLVSEYTSWIFKQAPPPPVAA